MPGPLANKMKEFCHVVDDEWPEAWYMVEDEKVENQKCENRLAPNRAVPVKAMKKLGLNYWKMDAENYSYPVKSIPWDPKDATDPRYEYDGSNVEADGDYRAEEYYKGDGRLSYIHMPHVNDAPACGGRLIIRCRRRPRRGG